ncbi:hypothetical protein [Dehalogenimonas etheniformans]|uniref:hypothetical protein n=1 Tax=Dehalogenimonas etheniformans TaxID=1536648 RepID=UPI001392477E|nr:hypothetical protein [Dehalogenimonas etheniformans]QNT75825.1 hypothetical protein HX448_03550 [Dehalogenimonas etheniformans]
MKKIIPAVVAFLVTYLVSDAIIGSFIIGNSTGDELIKTLSPLGLGFLASFITLAIGK